MRRFVSMCKYTNIVSDINRNYQTRMGVSHSSISFLVKKSFIIFASAAIRRKFCRSLIGATTFSTKAFRVTTLSITIKHITKHSNNTCWELLSWMLCMLCVITLSAIMLSGVMPSAVMPTVLLLTDSFNENLFDIWGQCYKSFYGRKLRLFIISQSICHWQAFPA